LTEVVKIQMMTDIAIGMNYLHTHEPIILHRDLKSTNILVNTEWQCKIADFGLSRLQLKSAQRMSLVGTPGWAAPEVLRREKYNKKADVWSYGVIVWEFVTYQKPFDEKGTDSIFECAQHNETPDLTASDCPEFFETLMTKCWRIPASERLSFEEIVNKLLCYQPNQATTIPLQVMAVDNVQEKKRARLPKKRELSSPANMQIRDDLSIGVIEDDGTDNV